MARARAAAKTEAPPVEAPAEVEEVEVEEAVADPAFEAPVVAPELAIAIREERSIATPPAASLPSEREWKATIAVATEIARTQFVPESYRGQPEAVVAAILTGRELGIGPMESLRAIHMIDGRATLSANLLLAQMRKGGLVILESESTMERAWIKARRSDTGEVAEVEWTYEEASRIKRRGKLLVDGDNWQNYRPDMLWARCVGRLARRLGPDLVGGMVYTAEEVQDFDGSGYGETTAQPPVEWATLDPGVTMHPDSPKGWKPILDVLEWVNPALNWPWIVQGIFRGKYGVATVAELGERQQEAGRRLANLAAYLRDEVLEGKDFPPASDEQVVSAIGWAFEGLHIDLSTMPPRPEVELEEGLEQALEADEVHDPEETGAALSAEQQAEMDAAAATEIEFGEAPEGRA